MYNHLKLRIIMILWPEWGVLFPTVRALNPERACNVLFTVWGLILKARRVSACKQPQQLKTKRKKKKSMAGIASFTLCPLMLSITPLWSPETWCYVGVFRGKVGLVAGFLLRVTRPPAARLRVLRKGYSIVNTIHLNFPMLFGLTLRCS